MEGLFPFLIIIGIVNAIIKWARKQTAGSQKGQGQGPAPDKPWQRMIGDMAKSVEEAMTGKQPEKPVYKTLKNPVYNGEGTGSGEGRTFSAGMNYQRPATISGSPYSLSSEGTSQPQETAPQWRGSLSGTEGSVAFTASLKDTPVVESVQETYPALNLQFNRDTLVQAVVMQEILTRPQDRRRRWRQLERYPRCDCR